MNGITEGAQNILVKGTANLFIILAVIIVPILLGLIAHFILYVILGSLAKHRPIKLYSSLITHTKNPARWFMLFFILNMAMPAIKTLLPEDFSEIIRSVLVPLIIASLSWLLINFLNVLEDMILEQYDIEKENMRARGVKTQLHLLKRILTIVMVIIAIGAILMTFDRIRQLGTAILASAGVAGIIIGVAAQRSVANLLAGIQIALTEPIRLDDGVIVEGEYGNVEEITLTYVVVKLWDNRRMVLPIVYFIEKPFQNLTRVSTNLMGTVYLYVDYSIPVDEIRNELQNLLKESPVWDGKTWGLHVTDLKDKTMELRALVSAKDSDDLWNIRCQIREKLINFVQRNYPRSLPKIRAEMEKNS
jgi:small-conductance mechanosensitive channel